jgi:hypothetical protein
LGWLTGAVVLIGAVAGLAGQFFCLRVPKPAGAHVFIMCSVLSMAATIV